MITNLIDSFLVFSLLLNFFVLAVGRLQLLIVAVSLQGAFLGLMYPLVHGGVFPTSSGLLDTDTLALIRLGLLTLAIMTIKGLLIPKLLFRAVQMADVRPNVSSILGFVPTLLLGGVATAAAVFFSRSLPPSAGNPSLLLIPAALATVVSGFLVLITRREALAQILGYIVMENGIFIFGLLLVEAVPLLVELGVVLDLIVGVFVMGIIVNHVSRAFPEASSEHLSTLKEE